VGKEAGMAKRTKLSYGDFRPLRKGETGYSKTARKYISSSSGEVIPVARFQKLAKGIPSKTAKPSKPNTQYTSFISRFVDKQNRELTANNLNPNFTRGEARTNPQFKRAYANLKKEGKKKSVDRSAHGPLAEALEDLGIREENADYPVGETPD
jgi:hypothetical protein